MEEVLQDTEQIDQPPKLSVKDFAAKIKAKYPDYSDIGDDELVQKIVSKYPEYKEQIDFSQKKSLGGNGSENGGTTYSKTSDGTIVDFRNPFKQVANVKNPEYPIQRTYNGKTVGFRNEQEADFYESNNGVVHDGGTPKNIRQAVNKDKQLHGNRFGFIMNQLGEGISSLVSGSGDVVMQTMINTLPESVVGGKKEEVRKAYREKVTPQVRQGINTALTEEISPELKEKYQNELVTSSIGGIANFAPAMAAPKGTKAMAFFTQAYDGGLQMINSTEEGSKLPENAKSVFATTIGAANAYLMKVGFDKILGGQTNKVATGLAVQTVKDLLKKSSKPITTEAFKAALDVTAKSFKNRVINAGSKVAQSAIIGGVMNTAIEGTNEIAKEITNNVAGRDIFEPTSWGETLKGIGHAFASGAIGGAVLGGVGVPFSKTRDFISEKVAKAKSPEDIVALKEELRNTHEGGELSVEDIGYLNSLVDDYVRVNSKVPDDVPDRKGAVEKIMEREEVQKAADEKSQELENVDDAFKPEIQNEIIALNNKAQEINEDIVNPKQPSPVVEPIVDKIENKNEDVYYRGSEHGGEIDRNNIKPVFFSKNKEYAEKYGKNVKEFTVKISKPFDTKNKTDLDIYNNEFIPYALEKSKGDKRYEKLKEGESIPFTTADLFYVFLRKKQREGEHKSYDGVSVDERVDGEGSIFPLSHEQISEKQPSSKPVDVPLDKEVKIKSIADIKNAKDDIGRTSEQIELEHEIKENGIVPILIDKEGNVLDGEHRIAALKHLGVENIPTIEVPDFKTERQRLDFEEDIKTNHPPTPLEDLKPIKQDVPLVEGQKYDFIGENIIKGEKHEGLNREEAIDRILTDLLGTLGASRRHGTIEAEINKLEEWLMRPDNDERYVKPETIQKYKDGIKELKELQKQGFETFEQYAESKLTPSKTDVPLVEGKINSIEDARKIIKENDELWDERNKQLEPISDRFQKGELSNKEYIDEVRKLDEKFSKKHPQLEEAVKYLYEEGSKKLLDNIESGFSETLGLKKQIKQDVPLVDKEKQNEIIQETNTENKQSNITSEEGGEPKKGAIETPPPTGIGKERGVVHSEQPPMAFKKKEFVRARNRVGIDEFVDENKTTHLERATEANRTIEKWKKDGTYDDKIADIQERAKVGRINNEEQFIFAKHLADLDATVNSIKDINSAEYDAALTQYTDALQVAGAARSEFGRQLGMIAVNKGQALTLADWMAERKQALGVDNLSEQQKAETKKMFDEYDAKLKVAEEKQAKADEEISKLKAELEFKTQIQQQKAVRKKNREQLSKEREDIIAAIKEKWDASKGELSATFIPYAKQLISVAPDVQRLVRNLVETGVSKLSDVVDTVHAVLLEKNPDITKKDVNDLIAGVYSERKPTLSEHQKQLKQLRAEAKSESAEFQMQDKKRRTEEEIKKIEEKIKNKDYAPERKLPIGQNEMLRKANPHLWKETMDAIIAKDAARDKLELAKHRDELARRPLYKKVISTGGKVLTTAKAIKAGIDDSVTGVQLLLAIYSNPKAGIKAKIEAIKDINNSRFKRQLASLHNDPFWNTIKESGLDITEPKSLSKENLEELYSGNLLDTKIGGKVNLWTYTGGIFERLFTSMGNNLRLNLFRSQVNEMISQGRTFESHPQEYKDIARAINELTARGKVAKELQGASSVISPIIWAPKMISSSLNILGISDLAMGIKGRGYYQNLTPEARAFAVHQLVNGVGTGVAIMAAFAARGWTIDKDPRSVGFGSITSPDGNRRYNVFGRFSSTAKTVVQLVSGVKTVENKEKDLDAREGRGVTLWKYFRGKMTPFAGEVGDYVLNRKRNTFTGKPIKLSTLPQDLIAPISVTDIKQGWSNSGYDAILNRMIPAIEGIQVQDKRDFIDKDLPSLIERNKRSEDQDTSNFVNYKNGGKPITKDERSVYVKKRDSIIEAELTKLFKGTSAQNKVIENEKVVTKPYKDMSREQIIDATTAIKKHATVEAKKELFGEPLKSSNQLQAESELEYEREKIKAESK